jgi:hypothetical protein
MSVSVESLAEDFSAADRAALAELAEQLWAERPAIAAEWSDRIAAARPQDFEPRGPLTLDLLASSTRRFSPPYWRRCATAT